MSDDDGLRASIEKMRAEGLGQVAIDTFAHYYEQLREGESGMFPESEIEPVDELPALDDLPAGDASLLDAAVAIKLNGGLGTSMGMTRAKSLIEAKDGKTFLDLIVGQVVGLRERFGARVPLVLMNSFATREDSLAALAAHPELTSDVPADFVQNKVPKIRADDLRPVSWPDDPALEWAPPGHGDLYTALVTSGMLDELTSHGYRW
ncbi:MAG: UTP--glucose-phosphate uridylyltransferase, partial [Solirubrobacteraceae bacterium]|nr:UTP--glucose-phosphate uridylyltransferase [Solirubrobacteraceae bacterium]